MKIVCTSDLHGHLPQLPKCDLLLIAGDVCPSWNHDLSYQFAWLHTRFYEWLRDAPARKIILVWGNHDLIAEQEPGQLQRLNQVCTILTDELHVWEGLRIYGLPWQLRFFDWAFNLDEPELSEKYARIPECDIIVSHGPPAYMRVGTTVSGVEAGSEAFLRRIDQIQPSLVVCGHIHEGAGAWVRYPTVIANVSHLDEKYRVTTPPVMFELKPLVSSMLWDARDDGFENLCTSYTLAI